MTDPPRTRCFAARLLTALTLWISAVGGCATWKSLPEDDAELVSIDRTAVKHHTQSIVVDAVFTPLLLPVPDDQWDDLWQSVDETPIDAVTRARYLDNGLRIGLVSDPDRVAAKLQSLAPQKDIVGKFMDNASIGGTTGSAGGLIPMRLNQRHELPLHDPVGGPQTILVRTSGQTIGRTLEGPQGLLAIVPSMSPRSGKVRLEIGPEIQHGSTRQSFFGSRAGVRIEQRRESWVIDELKWRLDLEVGQSLLIIPDRIAGASPAEPSAAAEVSTAPAAAHDGLFGLGAAMLGSHSTQRQAQAVAVLLRLTHLPDPADTL